MAMINEGILYKLKATFPLVNGETTIELLEITQEAPEHNETECRAQRLTYSSPLRLTFSVTAAGQRHEVLRREYAPCLTEKKTWLILGKEYAPIDKLHQPPGVFFSYNETKKTYRASVFPKQGVKLHLEIDQKGLLIANFVQQKVSAPLFLSATGCTMEQVLCLGEATRYTFEEGKFWCFIEEPTRRQRSAHKVRGPQGERLLEQYQVITWSDYQQIKAVWGEKYPIDEAELQGHVCAQDVINPETGEVVAECNERFTLYKLQYLKTHKPLPFRVLDLSDEASRCLHRTYEKYPAHDTQEISCRKLYSMTHKLELSSLEEAQQDQVTQDAASWIDDTLFRDRLYNLSNKGRAKLNSLPHREIASASEGLALTQQDIIEVLRHLFLFKEQREKRALEFLCFQRLKTNEELLAVLIEIWLEKWSKELSLTTTPYELQNLISEAPLKDRTLQGVAEAYFQQ
jgi:DNA-directed RNA polymerase subunit beta